MTCEEEQRKLILPFLGECGFPVSKRGGRGRKDDTSCGILKKPHDLSNWKWVAACNGDSWISIPPQPIDRDYAKYE